MTVPLQSPTTPLGRARQHPTKVTVVGAGVIGLTVALELCEHGFDVDIVARDLPTDQASSMQWASPWAGANWCSYADGNLKRIQNWERTTWHRFREIHKARPDMIDLIPIQHELEASQSLDVWFKDLVPKFRVEESKHMLHYESFCLDVPNYLNYLYHTLLDQWQRGGGKVTFRRVSTVKSLAECLSHDRDKSIGEKTSAATSSTKRGKPPTIIVNCTSSGSRALPEAGRDECLYGGLGQTVLVRVPPTDQEANAPFHPIPMKIRPAGSFTSSCRGINSLKGESDGGKENINGHTTDRDPASFSYIIPRARSGTVILGGTFIPSKLPDPLDSSNGGNDWQAWRPDEAETKRIVAQCLEWEPRLATVSASGERTVDIISVGLGVRPMRKGGARVERDKFADPRSSSSSKESDIVEVVHAYGLGGAGYQQSWGVASNVRTFVEEILEEAKGREMRGGQQ